MRKETAEAEEREKGDGIGRTLGAGETREDSGACGGGDGMVGEGEKG